MKKSVNAKTNISNLVKAELPKMHVKLIKKFKGKHNLINKFIYVPDLINGDDTDSEKNIIINSWKLSEFLSTGSINYTLYGFSLDKSLSISFQYSFEDKESGLGSFVHVVEAAEGWVVKKIEVYDEIF
jgi:hypothetical protein